MIRIRSNALKDGNAQIVKDLIPRGVDVNAKNDDGDAPLHIAAEKSYKEIVDALLEKEGIDINVKDNKGITPLHIADLTQKK
ncbi:ankyrin repeat domain-containing protein [Wolbachia endosymbiont of Laodelphax striatellus]|uniref:ankyrin repeat domain-containing protein n=1 Tax=Wolbachia endosymbiont of Laodelphax striatellus TaxID=368602 RepID=UPI0013155945|nr:ankyrin repeat domain-containing protein [Wolbachia endosymbiont of Laodelphax striatellus]